MVKTPKIHYLDNGIIQAVLQKKGGITGNEFESLVIAEIYKQVQTTLAPVPFFHLRTQDGREVDLLVELPNGYLAFEIKMAENVGKQDAKHLVKLEQFLDKPLLHAFVLSNDLQIKSLEEGITAVHAAYFLG